MATDGPNLEAGPLVRQWAWPLRWAFWCLLIVIAVWVATVVAHRYWALRERPDAPAAHQSRLLALEMRRLATLEPGLFEPRELAMSLGTALRDAVVLNAIGFARTLMNWPVAYRQAAARARGESDPSTSSDPGGDLVLEETGAGGQTWNMLVGGTYLFAARTSLFLCGLPVLIGATVLALVDGLVRRACRKADAGRESASLYHRGKLGLSFVGITSYLAMLVAPSITSPAALLVPIAVAMAAFLHLQVAFYKKYL